MSAVPDFPRIEVTLRPDTSGEVTIQGISHPVPVSGDIATARQRALGIVVVRAALALGRPVRVTAHDPEGTWPLVVHPAGHVTDPAQLEHEPHSPTPTDQGPVVCVRAIDGTSSQPGRSILVGRNPQPHPGELVEVLFAVRDVARQVSKTHARIDIDPTGHITVTDRSSTNGTGVLLHGTRRPAHPGAPLTVPAAATVLLGDVPVKVEVQGS
ncbi:FHA domain-containing protein [Actinotalea sp. C106]|uniref:FHA domain-containing protein n=1 Tax=Actinotalea sp. C106 TaxID=2908644 RepID=UPI002027B06A|nr:FHA domain-containing protein [Actinotalea sp. C106]